MESSSSLEGGEDGGDDDDNIAYSTVVKALVPEDSSSSSSSVFSHSLLSSGQTVSLTALHLPSLNSLFVFLKSGNIASISKECFISLLEHAEEILHCSMVYVFFRRSITDDKRQQILRSFRVMGFQIMPPSHTVTSVLGSEYYFMSYQLEDDSDDD